MNHNQRNEYGGFDPPFPDRYVKRSTQRRNMEGNHPQTERKSERIKKWFTRNKDEDEYETENESDSNIYVNCDDDLNEDIQFQQLRVNDSKSNKEGDVFFPFDEAPPSGVVSCQHFQHNKNVTELDSATSNKTLLTGNRPSYDPFNVVGPSTSIPNKNSKPKEFEGKRSSVVVVSSKNNIINNLHSAFTDPHMRIKIGPTKLSDITWRFESYIAKRKQSLHILQKTINDFKSWTPQGEVIDQEDTLKMTGNFVEMMENELEYEVNEINALESTLSTLKTVSSKEDRYIESRKQLKTAMKKYNDSKVKKNKKSTSNSELLRSEYVDSQRRYSNEQTILQDAISIDLRIQFISHNYQNFANNSDLQEKSKENISNGLKMLSKVDEHSFKQIFEEIRKQRMTYNWNHLSKEEQKNSRTQVNFQNGLIDKNDSLLSCIYKELALPQVPSPLTAPLTEPEKLHFTTNIGKEKFKIVNGNSNCASTNEQSQSILYYNTEKSQVSNLNQETYEYENNEISYTTDQGTNKENETVIQNTLEYTKNSEPNRSVSFDKSVKQRFEVLTGERYEFNTMGLEKNNWEDK
ncbi:hypothetical protein MOUN0_D05248 [Monosporozyma unispora]|nr:hypothetical protein C6P44_003060 [Kazachstania unispora]